MPVQLLELSKSQSRNTIYVKFIDLQNRIRVFFFFFFFPWGVENLQGDLLESIPSQGLGFFFSFFLQCIAVHSSKAKPSSSKWI